MVSVNTRPLKVRLFEGTEKTVFYYSGQMEVEETFKGQIASQVEADSGTGGGDCSFGKIVQGAEYIVFANNASDRIVRLRLCTGTAKAPDDASGAAWAAQYKEELVTLRKLAQADPK